MENDEFYMHLALQEAKKGRFHTWKNPMVGAVIVKDNQILATGYHHQYGDKHAERDAISKLTPEQLLNSTLYVTLEPCNHFGKQPPCSKLIVESGIKRVVIAQTDPHLLVHNRGIGTLEKNHIEVTKGVLANEAEKLNKHYSYFYGKQTPWITVKQSISLDGKVAACKNQRTAITNNLVYERVHEERADYHAIVIGSRTAIIDNPTLLTSIKQAHPPIRVIMDRRGRLIDHLDLKILNDQKAPTWIITNNQELLVHSFNVNVKTLPGKENDIKTLLELLAAEELQSIYVEGGPTLEKEFLDNFQVNELVTYLDPKLIGEKGVSAFSPAKACDFSKVKYEQLGSDIRIEERDENV